MSRRQAIVISGLMLAFATATSCGPQIIVERIAAASRGIIAGSDIGGYLLSTDGGRTFEEVGDAVTVGGANVQTQVCNDSGVCVRVDGGQHVEESLDGGQTWTTGWKVPSGRAEFLARYYWGGCSSFQLAATEAIAVGDDFLVAVGSDGILRRNADGTWDRDITGLSHPFSEWGRNLYPEVITIASFSFLVWTLGSGLAWRRLLAPRVYPVGRLLNGVAVAAGCWCVFSGIMLLDEPNRIELVFMNAFPLLLIFAAFLAVVSFPASIVTWYRWARAGESPIARMMPAWRLAACAAVVGTLNGLVWVGWSGGLIPWWWLAVVLTGITVLAVIAAVARTITSIEPEPKDPTPVKSIRSRWPGWSLLASLPMAAVAARTLVGASEDFQRQRPPVGRLAVASAVIALIVAAAVTRRRAAWAHVPAAALVYPLLAVGTPFIVFVPFAFPLLMVLPAAALAIAMEPPNRVAIRLRIAVLLAVASVAFTLPRDHFLFSHDSDAPGVIVSQVLFFTTPLLIGVADLAGALRKKEALVVAG